MKNSSHTILKYMFMLGFILDTGIALNWFLIAAGYELPSIHSGYIGSGQDYQFTMYIVGMFDPNSPEIAIISKKSYIKEEK